MHIRKTPSQTFKTSSENLRNVVFQKGTPEVVFSNLPHKAELLSCQIRSLVVSCSRVMKIQEQRLHSPTRTLFCCCTMLYVIFFIFSDVQSETLKLQLVTAQSATTGSSPISLCTTQPGQHLGWSHHPVHGWDDNPPLSPSSSSRCADFSARAHHELIFNPHQLGLPGHFQ